MHSATGAVAIAPAIGSVAAATLAPAPAIGTVAPAATLAPAPAIGTVAPAAMALAPAIGTVAASPAPIGSVTQAPPIGSVTTAPSQRMADLSARHLLERPPYAPPTASIPDAPEVPGKWVPQYTRDKRSYVVPGLDGLAHTDTFTRATSHSKVLDDSSALTDWRLRATVLGLARNPELLDGLSLDGADHISELDFGSKLALTNVSNQAARRAGADDGSDFGTKLHGYLQAVLEGVLTVEQVPSLFVPYLRVLFAAMRRHRLSFVAGMVERTVFIPATGMVGTLDFLAITEDGTLVVGDLKTSSSIDYSWLAIGVQLGQYAGATMMLSWDGTYWEPMPPVSQVIAKVVSVPKDSAVPQARIYTVDLTLGMEMVDEANRVQAIHEAARRAASFPQLRREGDELMAWADGDPVLLTSITAAVPPAVN